jgi:hypothetical protein
VAAQLAASQEGLSSVRKEVIEYVDSDDNTSDFMWYLGRSPNETPTILTEVYRDFPQFL